VGAGEVSAFKPLPPSSPNPDALFGFDLNVSSATIDEYLGNPDAVFYDTRPQIDLSRMTPAV
jgi:hypothetical protein